MIPLTHAVTLYFGYGSNLWREQMLLRCPSSTYIGIGRLDGFRWFINERGYANVIRDDDGSHVYGLIYTLTLTDEAALDRNEGVPNVYEKALIPVNFWSPEDGNVVDTTQKSEVKSMLVYIDSKRNSESKPKKEYIYRMNAGVKDALAAGVPKAYIGNVIRKFIPEASEADAFAKNIARRQANRFVEESDEFC
ncbi:MAG: hypothetical protein Q9163_000200 [Psora crenata]